MAASPHGSRPAVESAESRADILVVDGTLADCRVLSQLLSAHGYGVRVAGDGEQGIEAARLAPPDLVVLGARMPDLDGYEVCRRLKGDPRTRSVPIIFICALGSAEDRVLAFQAGGEDYVARPLHPSEVLARVRAHLSRRQVDAALGRRAALAETLARSAARLGGQLDLEAVLAVVGEEVAAALRVPIVSVRLYDARTDSFRPAGGFGLPPNHLQSADSAPRDRIDRYFAEMGPVVVLPDAQAVPDLPLSELAGSLDLRTILGVRLEQEGEPVGMLVAATTGDVRRFSEDALQLLRGIAGHATLAIANARLFEEVRAGREQLRAFSHRLMEAQERERRDVARELHDEIGQLVTGLKLTLASGPLLPVRSEPARLAEARALAEELARRVRSLSLDLRPAVLDDMGLLPALRWHIERYAVRTGVRVALDHAGVEGRRFDPRVETAAYRIAQEALTNVARHSQSKEAEVRIEADRDSLEIRVADRGVGFSLEAAPEAGASAGLPGLRERVALLGGSLAIESASGAGTRLVARLPATVIPAGAGIHAPYNRHSRGCGNPGPRCG